jgi:DNA helicase-2/ATP-dependent DNA helicase PcrA
MDFLEGLNEPQREAVLHARGPLMIIAGAGSGKTRVLTAKIAFLIEQGVEPFSILALTFTNKAAKEMRERIEKTVGKEAKNLWMGTFHSIFSKILRFEAEKIGYQKNFTIYDTDDSKSLISTIVKEMNLDDKIYKTSSVLSRISSAKNNLVTARMYNSNPATLADDEQAGRPKIGEIFKEYGQRCFKANAMDFDDLLLNTNILFAQHLDILNKYQHRFQFLMIDEFQDTNLAQYAIVKKLGAVHQNITVVGDDAQSIYAFRGANIENILNFEKDYPDLKVVKLEQNYRSSQNIVEAANSIIGHNKNQIKKKVWTSNHEGSLIEVIRATTDQDEGRLIAHAIFEEKMHNSLPNSDFAVLYRTNSQSRAIEEALRRMAIPYKIIGGMSFYQRKEVKDLIAYLRFLLNPDDEQAFKRIINYPKRGIGDTSVEKVIGYARQNGLTIWQTISKGRSVLGGRIGGALEDFSVLIQSFLNHLEKKDAYQLATQVAKDSQVLRELHEDKTLEGKVRYDNVQELLNSIKAFVDDPEREDKSLAAFLEEIALVSSADTETSPDSVTLMTIHMSKGLEFEVVFITGLEENLFPSQMMLQSRADLEEERRLFYVAVTRAKRKLTLSYSLQRYKYGRLEMCEPSRFLSDIDGKYLTTAKIGKAISQLMPQQPRSPQPKAAENNRQNPADYQPSPLDELKAGQIILHPKFGKGKIESIDESGSEKMAKVLFKEFGLKTLMLSFAKLMIVAE